MFVNRPRNLLFISLLLSCVFLWTGCEGQKEHDDPDTVSTGQRGSAKIDWDKIKSTAANDPRKKIDFDEYYVKFSVRQLDQWQSVPRDSLPWAAGIKQSPQTGNVAHFFFADEPRYSLEAAHVRVDWVYARQPNCSTVDSLYMWLENMFVKSRGGKIAVPRHKIGTYSGKEAWVEGIYSPQYEASDTTTKAEKWMAFAYIQDRDYWVGWVFTAHDITMWERGFALFKDLVATYEEEEWQGPN